MSGLAKEPEVLVDLASKSSALARQLLECDEAVANAFGSELAHLIATEWGGQSIYFATGLFYRVATLHQEVWEAFNGHNHNDLAKRFRISRAWVYRIVKRMSTNDTAKRQRGLFPGAPAE